MKRCSGCSFTSLSPLARAASKVISILFSFRRLLRTGTRCSMNKLSVLWFSWLLSRMLAKVSRPLKTRSDVRPSRSGVAGESKRKEYVHASSPTHLTLCSFRSSNGGGISRCWWTTPGTVTLLAARTSVSLPSVRLTDQPVASSTLLRIGAMSVDLYLQQKIFDVEDGFTRHLIRIIEVITK